ncbi:uncharacterized protein F4812DRAFT_456014 [Daldinia caldariorum]|uniref:uncharacterized protein n=1 Tax=Daldinia caldariorum TaxID=326644 RepID=UPI0020084CBE|nr:uncharacterized protein F4812DRAFT_456014 [Daldinia caldariorum]KAI1471911.1 hypothetical protein F4812DRAFT_456014 [Daldinia caldariorum]
MSRNSSGQNAGNSDKVFERAGVSKDEFYNNASIIQSKQIQQRENEDVMPVFLDGQTSHKLPHSIHRLIGGSMENGIKKKLGENLLDSFAFIFTQPGGRGVVAVAMEWSDKDPNKYTLHVRKNYPSYSELVHISKAIEEWFADEPGDATKDVLELDRNDTLWEIILHNCHQGISLLIRNGFGRRNKSQKISALSDALKRAIDKNSNPHTTEAGNDIILEVLREFKKFLRTRDRATSLHKITELCFKLAESHGTDMKERFNTLKGEFKREYQFSNRIEHLIYSLANYRRAWYDIAYFRAQHNSTTLNIKFNLDQPSSSMKQFPKPEILKINGKGIFDETKKESSYKTKIKRMKKRSKIYGGEVEYWKHCEMQILELLLDFDGKETFFDYIGRSKCPCWLCHHILSSMTSEFRMRRSHMKLYPKWKPPEFRSEQNQKRLAKKLKLLHEKMAELVTQPGTDKSGSTQTDCPDIKDTFLSPRREYPICNNGQS